MIPPRQYEQNIEPETGFLKRLKFRRQFLIGPDQYLPNEFWLSKKINHNLFLSIHKDLDFYTETRNERRITLIGIAVDCTSPFKPGSKIVNTLLDRFHDISSVIHASKPLAGRWALICQDADNTFVFNDPCGMRQVYYTSGKNSWLASQPTLINQVEDLVTTSNKSILSYRNSTFFKKKESPWIGNKTVYDNCLHLMPNHYLDFNSCSQVRFFPKNHIPVSSDVDELCKKAATYLKNIMEGFGSQSKLKIGFSAGFDSRLLLAASVDIADNIQFRTYDLGGRLHKDYDDIYIPKKLARNLELHHAILDTDITLPDWFVDILSENVLEARTSPLLPKIKSIYKELADKNPDTPLLGGNVTEIVRVHEIRLKKEASYNNSRSRGPEFIFKYSGENDFIKNEIETWLNSFDISLIEEATIFDMFYWEQRMGNWGALFPTEFDIAAESANPFNCRLLLQTCFKVPREQRIGAEYTFFINMIKKLWPETLSEPINPGPKGFGLFKKILRENLPSNIVNTLRKLAS